MAVWYIHAESNKAEQFKIIHCIDPIITPKILKLNRAEKEYAIWALTKKSIVETPEHLSLENLKGKREAGVGSRHKATNVVSIPSYVIYEPGPRVRLEKEEAFGTCAGRCRSQTLSSGPISPMISRNSDR